MISPMARSKGEGQIAGVVCTQCSRCIINFNFKTLLNDLGHTIKQLLPITENLNPPSELWIEMKKNWKEQNGEETKLVNVKVKEDVCAKN